MPPYSAQRGHALTPSGQDLVRVGLMADVPYQSIIRSVEHVVQCHGEFDRAQVRGQMSAGTARPIRAGTVRNSRASRAAACDRACADRRVVDGIQQVVHVARQRCLSGERRTMKSVSAAGAAPRCRSGSSARKACRAVPGKLARARRRPSTLT